MRDHWIISDTHFGDETIMSFRSDLDFENVAQLDAYMVERWNAVVKPQDRVYHLGDIAYRRKDLSVVRKLNGHIRLVRGNHDVFATKDYIGAGIKEIHGMRVLPAHGKHIVLTHAPVHPNVVNEPAFIGNIHGHLHATPSPPGPYFNVSVERLNYRPELLQWAIEQCLQKVNQESRRRGAPSG